VVADGWIVLQVARRIDLYAAGANGAAAIASTLFSSDDVKLAQNEGEAVADFYLVLMIVPPGHAYRVVLLALVD
jgi:hypothetical protein